MPEQRGEGRINRRQIIGERMNLDLNPAPRTVPKASQAEAMHLSIAEGGKVHALKGQHDEALTHYREAIRLCVSSKSSEIFFRHYTQCTLESLELSGSYHGVIEYCRNAETHFESIPFSTRSLRKDRASNLERLGIALLKTGDHAEALEQFERAIEIANDTSLHVAKQLTDWLKRRLTPDAARIQQLQRKHNYFCVRKDQVDPARAKFIDPQQTLSPLGRS